MARRKHPIARTTGAQPRYGFKPDGSLDVKVVQNALAIAEADPTSIPASFLAALWLKRLEAEHERLIAQRRNDVPPPSFERPVDRVAALIARARSGRAA